MRSTLILPGTPRPARGGQRTGVEYQRLATRSGGKHLLFRHARGLRNSAGKLAHGVDVRADGGYIVWWPAAGYPVTALRTLAEWPEWLLEQLLTPPSPAPRPFASVPTEDGTRRYALAALRSAVERVAGAWEGGRNHALNIECFSLARFVPDKLGADELADALAIAARYAGLSARETAATLASALRAGSSA
jgi:hypothetical protein